MHLHSHWSHVLFVLSLLGCGDETVDQRTPSPRKAPVYVPQTALAPLSCDMGKVPVFSDHGFEAVSGGVITELGAPLVKLVCVDERARRVGEGQGESEAGSCPAGQVEFIHSADPAAEMATSRCVGVPPVCTAGQHLDFEGDRWVCRTCEVVIQYGSLFGGRRVCARRPVLACPSGKVPTLVYETNTWECRQTCDNGEYDQLMLDNRLVCVPC